MNAPAIAQPVSSPPRLIAPLWHTALFLATLAALGVWGAQRRGLPNFGGSRLSSYMVAVACEWLLVALAIWGMRLRGVSVRSVIGGKWSRPLDFLRDLGIAVVFLLGSIVVLNALTAVLRPGPSENVNRILPHSGAEILAWIFVSLTAGICEEFTTRGYLQRQLSGLTRNVTAGVILQGVIFGAAHLYQGPKRMFIIAVLGCMMGWLAQWQKSLRPGMLSHFMQDVAGGIFHGGH